MSGIGDVLLRIGDEGWLVIADNLPSLSGEFAQLADRIIAHVDISYSPFLIYAGDEGEDPDLPFVEDVEGILGVRIEHVPLQEAQNVQVVQPGLFILTGGIASDWINALGTSQLGEALQGALNEGALIFAAEGAAASLGSWVLERGEESATGGLEWLPGAIVLPWLDDPANSERVRALLAHSEPLYAIGIANGRLLAYGPHGQVEVWGVSPPTLALGAGWR
jgi:hypothetical protein